MSPVQRHRSGPRSVFFMSSPGNVEAQLSLGGTGKNPVLPAWN